MSSSESERIFESVKRELRAISRQENLKKQAAARFLRKPATGDQVERAIRKKYTKRRIATIKYYSDKSQTPQKQTARKK